MGESMVEVVNIAAGGEIGSEVDIEQVAHDSDLPVSNFNPENNATFLRFEEDGELVILYTSGKYILRGGDDFDNMYRVNDQFISHLSQLGLEISNPTLETKNVVVVGDLEREVNLEALMIGLGLEQAEYEPEQFPGLVYRPSDKSCVLLVFASGKVVITGSKTKSEAQDAFDRLEMRIEDML
jgi:transcription initiation factor TFIID TATA-box-binding protein